MSDSKVFVYSSEASDRWSDSSDHPTSSGAATWSVTAADSNAELIVPRVTFDLDDEQLRRRQQLQRRNNSNTNSTTTDIGHLCIMVCGDSGIGKTQLVQALATAMPEMTTAGTTEDVLFDDYAIQETRVSIDDNNDEQQRQQKTICFVDTPGYGACLDAESVIASVTHYIERQFQRTNAMLNPLHANTPELTRLVHNTHGAHTHIDACVYIVLDRLKRVDIEYMRALQPLCNLIPIILTHTTQQQQHRSSSSKASPPISLIQLEFEEQGIEPFDLLYPLNDINSVVPMFCDRVLFCPSRLRQIRQNTAEKFVTWRASQHIVMEQQDEDDLSTTLSASTLTTAETVDRIHALRARHAQNMNLFISRYVSEKRKLMERDMFERERALRQELASVERRKRAELLLTELNALFQQGSLGDFDGVIKGSASPLAAATATANKQQKQQQQKEEEQQQLSRLLLLLLEGLQKNSLKVAAMVLFISMHLLFDVYQWWTNRCSN
ncbi:Septin-domain-containing protein [Zychaea mexicana]|uniref:Septin-domain-containing protein n=1 Tax=Zychaea mexicana TaxID=64656 RepID=UPI0022FE9CDC|nr:Septin-domain-containing protein [Zychaea mexicana]KAI9490295.1 Septin-domain-containing protein [Zychaea mexicana]